MRRYPYALALFLVLPLAASAQQAGEMSYHDESVMPEGAVGERIRSIIETVNADDAEAVRRFIEEECTEEFQNFVSMDEHVSVFFDLNRRWGGADFHSIRSYTPPRENQTVVILKDRNFGAWRAFVVQFDESEEQLVTGLRFNVARTPSNVVEAALSEADVIQQVDELVRHLCDRDAFSGTMLLAKGDDVLLTHACGEASKRFHVANNLQTRFNLGSMNKMFTATSIAQLAERGLLSYYDSISRYVDESWLPREITDKITIHHLLTHTSGLGSYFNDTYWNASREMYRTVEDFKPLWRISSRWFRVTR
jgi:hypothetical protein